jgi:hypothetical protein
MEKKEARVKCSGCGTHYKLKFPATDKPIRFQCKKCGKTLSIRIKPPDQTAPAPPTSSQPAPPMMPEFETTQLPDWQESDGAPTPDGLDQTKAADSRPTRPQSVTPEDRRWLVLSDEEVKGPFNNDEIADMIKARFITSETSLRMGQRPWIKAGQVPDFKDSFPESRASAAESDQEDSAAAKSKRGKRPKDSTGSLKEQLLHAIPYPFGGGNWQPLAIFAGIAFALSAVLAFDFLIGLPLSIIGWILLYGYLADLMTTSEESSENPPPQMDFSRIREMIELGVRVFSVLAVYSLIPVSIALLFMIAFFLNGMEMLGYIFLFFTLVIYGVSLLLVAPGLIILRQSQKLGEALNPSKIIAVALSGESYVRLASVSITIGLVCMLAVLAAVFIADLLPLGFLFAALVMGLVLSYGHFIWFHLLGEYSKENSAAKLPAPAPASGR